MDTVDDVVSRLKKKKAKQESSADYGILAFARGTAIYKRLSTHEQVQNSRFSIERQHRLELLAMRDGYRAELNEDDLEKWRSNPNHPNFYSNGQIYVIEADLGISGTKGQEDRPGLAKLMELIHEDVIESIYVVEVSRLFRDDAMVQAPAFAQLCLEKNVIIVTDGMRFDFRNDMNLEYFLIMAKFAGRELKVIMNRLSSARALKVSLGFYGGGNVAAGFYVDFDKNSPHYEEYLIYPPHAEVCIELFHLAVKHQMSTVAILNEVRMRNIYFPLFEPEIGIHMNSRSALRFSEPKRDENGKAIGYEIGRGLLRSMFQNPAYVGQPIRSGDVVEGKKHPSPVLIDPELFLLVNEMMVKRAPKRRGKVEKHDPHLLQGLLQSDCRFGKMTPVYFSADPRMKFQTEVENRGTLGCACGDYHPGLGACFKISAHVIIEPVEAFVLSQIAFPEFAEKVRQTIQDDYSRSKAKADSFKRERKILETEITNLRANFSKIVLDGPTAIMLQQEIETRVAKLKQHEESEMRAYNETSLHPNDIEIISGFLTDLRSDWPGIPHSFKHRLFHLLLSKVVIKPLEDGNFIIRIVWHGGIENQIWVERPTMSSQCKPWTDEDKAALTRLYPNAPISDVLAYFYDRNVDAIRSMAIGMGLTREVSSTTPWKDEDTQILQKLDQGVITYRQARFALRQHRQRDIFRRMEHMGFKKPNLDALNWKELGNSQDNGSYCPG